MPKLHNPHEYDLFSHVLGEIVKAGEAVEITAEQAEKVSASGVWRILGDEKKADADKAVAKKAAAKKSAVVRGAKVTEVAAAPEVETA